MIVASIAGRTKPGCMDKASPFLRKYQEIVKEIAGVEVQIAGKLGAIGEVMVFSQHENASNFEEVAEKLWSSEAYRQVMDEGSEIFDGEATQVAVWKVL